MASLEPPSFVTHDAVTYRVQASRGLAPVWALAALILALIALGNGFSVPLATALFTISAALFGLAALLGAIVPLVRVGLHRLTIEVRYGVPGLGRTAVDLPWEAIGGARVRHGQLHIEHRSGRWLRTPVRGDPGQLAWVAGQILHHAERARLTEDDARSMLEDRARLQRLARGAVPRRVAR
jgi:hypothetical protein